MDPLLTLLDAIVQRLESEKRLPVCPGAASGCNYPEGDCAGVCHGN